MSDDIHKRIDQVLEVVNKMNENHEADMKEMNALMAKLIENQNILTTQMAEKSAYDRTVEKAIEAMQIRMREMGELITTLRIDVSKNNETRVSLETIKATSLRVIIGISLTGAIVAGVTTIGG